MRLLSSLFRLDENLTQREGAAAVRLTCKVYLCISSELEKYFTKLPFFVCQGASALLRKEPREDTCRSDPPDQLIEMFCVEPRVARGARDLSLLSRLRSTCRLPG